jgi:PAS domain S-box-containing protein
MSANDLLNLLFQSLFVLLGFLTTLDFLRYRDKTRRDIALMFGLFALIFVFQFINRLAGTTNPLLAIIGGTAFVSQPYLLLRLVQYFRPVPVTLMRVARIGMYLFWIVLILVGLLDVTSPPVVGLTLLLYFIGIDGYAMISFVRGAVASSGVVRQRLRFAAAGSGLLALALFLVAIPVLLPALRELIEALVVVVLIVAGLSYYISFAPPRWLRRTWQFDELRKFLLDNSSKPANERLNVGDSLGEICKTASRAVGGKFAAVIQWDEADSQWKLLYSNAPTTLVFEKRGTEGVIEQVWKERKSRALQNSKRIRIGELQLMEKAEANTLLIAPIATAEHDWGLVLVFIASEPLFLEDDLELVTLLAQQGANFLENSSLIEQLNRNSELLEKRVEERTGELRQSQAAYRRMIETAQEGIWITDNQYKTAFVNAKMAEILGCSVEEMLATEPVAFLDEEGKALAAQKRNERRGGIAEQYEMKFSRKDGVEIWALISSTPQFDDAGNYTGALAMVADITGRKQAEQALLTLNAELEQRVIERTAQYQAVNRELEAFSYSVSHDLRAPLRTLDGFSQALLEDYGEIIDEQGKHFLQRIRSGSQRMGQLIDALLQLSRLSRAEVQFEAVNLSEMVQAIKADLAEQFPERKVEFVIEEDVIVKGDERLLRVAMVNLLNNASKFSSKQPNARVEFGHTIEDGRSAYYVRDNGVGFDMAYADKLFGAFQRLHGMNEFEGTGIGLATVERIFHRHGGRVWANAAVNQGATFYFTL